MFGLLIAVHITGFSFAGNPVFVLDGTQNRELCVQALIIGIRFINLPFRKLNTGFNFAKLLFPPHLFSYCKRFVPIFCGLIVVSPHLTAMWSVRPFKEVLFLFPQLQQWLLKFSEMRQKQLSHPGISPQSLNTKSLNTEAVSGQWAGWSYTKYHLRWEGQQWELGLVLLQRTAFIAVWGRLGALQNEEELMLCLATG